MRFHRNYGQFELWTDPAALQRFARPENITAARLEPVIRQMLGHTVLDIVFRDGDRYGVIPSILVDSPQVVLREQDRFVWPAPVRGALDDERTIAIEQFLSPWLRALTTARTLSRETIRHFGSGEDRTMFEAARSHRFVGASPIEDAVAALAPYVYGARFSVGRNVLVAGAADGAQGAAFLARRARSVQTRDLEPAGEQVASRWFAWPPPLREFGMTEVLFRGPEAIPELERSLAHDAVELGVDDVSEDSSAARISAHAYPLDILFTYESLHGPAQRHFSISVPSTKVRKGGSIVRAHEPVGGSGGRILIGLRHNWKTAVDADVESALELARLLRSEGMHVDVSGEPTVHDYPSYDVVHAFNLIEVANAAAFLMRGRTAGVRTVLTATFTDVAGEKRQWGSETAPVPFRQELDETSVEGYLGFVARRALLTEGWEEGVRRGPVPNYDAMVAETLGLCDAVIAESAGEADVLRRFGYLREIHVIPPLLSAEQAAEASRPVSFEHFALVHAPVEPRNNQLLVARAARLTGIPLVVAGFVSDMEYGARLREIADETVTVVDPTREQTDWLYANAGTIIDASWYAFGTGRLRRAVLSGKPLGFSTSGWGPSLWPAIPAGIDPARVDSISEAICGAAAPVPEHAAREAAALDQSEVLRNVISAYLGSPRAAARG